MSTVEILAPLSRDAERRIERLRWLALLLDGAFPIPGGRGRFGLDGIIGLVPGIGDGASALLSLYIVYEAKRLGVPAGKLARMLRNIALDTLVGTVPLVGDLFDVVWKSNLRNVAILDEHFGTGRRKGPR
jgi:hypothetical protein